MIGSGIASTSPDFDLVVMKARSKCSTVSLYYDLSFEKM